MARPTKQVKRTEAITVRFTKAEKRLVEKYAERSGLRLAEFVHDQALDHQVSSRLTEDEVNIFRQLTGVANNLNQLAKKANQKELLVSKIYDVLEAINLLIDKLRK